MAEVPAETLALTQAVQVMLLWGERAFAEVSLLAVLPENGNTILRPEIAGVIAAARSDDACGGARRESR